MEADSAPHSKPDDPIAPVDAETRSGGDWAMYKYYFASAGLTPTVLFGLLQLTFGFFQTFPSVWLNRWSEASTAGTANNGIFVGVYSALQALSLASICTLCWYTFTVLIPRAGVHLHTVLLKTVTGANFLFLTGTDSGNILNRFSQDIELIDGDFPEALLDLFATMLMCFGQMALMALSSWYIALGYPLILVIIWAIQRYYLRTSRQIRLLDIENKSPLYSHFLETLGGLATIRAFGLERSSKEEGARLLSDSQKPYYMLLMIQHWLGLVLNMTCASIAVLIVGLSVATRQSASPGFTAIALVSLISFSETLKVLVSYWTRTETSLGALVRIQSFAKHAVAETDPSRSLMDPPPGWPSQGQIDIVDLTVSYQGSCSHVLQGLCLSVQAGERLAICGRTGSGKSTLFSALLGLVTPCSGSIRIDGLDVQDVSAQTIRSRVVVISQDPCLFTGSIRFNIDPWSEASDEAIHGALGRVGLAGIIDGARGLDGDDFDVTSLSHGQKQLFSLARATLRRGRIVILDEATSGVDDETESLMHAVIRDAFAGRTVIAVTHQLRGYMDFDSVALVKDGGVVERGRPRDLLNSASLLRDLFSEEVQRC